MPIKAGDLRRRFHRCVQDYAATGATPIWGLSGQDWGRANLQAAERLAQHILSLSDDDPRFVMVADQYTARGWDAARFPTAMLDNWLASLGGASSVPLDPDEFVTEWLAAERQHVRRMSNPRAGPDPDPL